ncbi:MULTISPECIES: sec-independent translocase [Kitasatospora]|uniref:Putative sec-independent protein translocase protein TatB n=1 Tax=Kitasatospora setae (strain ATCC 33774 / DSM 43861 / JCM 3304 / KCC A-0304 / NBRC 14216 / KM-6054) TaxID=452652 RepID=E4NGK4_KITSK|nr:sec-independent translocase [Kitasatospora setae]BAJ30634.1 putative sec-independent protein translocase protein TatB [Kitasatospora setae KM-6054]
MFGDIGGLEVATIVVLAIVIFGPDKLPKLIQDTMGFIRKIRSFADNAKEDIRSELGPEFQNFDFDDLNPKNFVRKQLLGDGDDPLGLKDLKDSVDLKSALSDPNPTPTASVDFSKAATAASAGPALAAGERPPFDPDAT